MRTDTLWFNKDGSRKKCLVCEEPVHCVGYCWKHYKRFKVTGNPLKTLRRENGAGGIVNGYLCISVKGKFVREHRFIMEKRIGRKLRKDEVVHHIDENKLNNSPENLEIMSVSDHVKIHRISTFRNNTHKQCTNCKLIKLRSEFWLEDSKKRKERPDLETHRSICKICLKVIRKH